MVILVVIPPGYFVPVGFADDGLVTLIGLLAIVELGLRVDVGTFSGGLWVFTGGFFVLGVVLAIKVLTGNVVGRGLVVGVAAVEKFLEGADAGLGFKGTGFNVTLVGLVGFAFVNAGFVGRVGALIVVGATVVICENAVVVVSPSTLWNVLSLYDCSVVVSKLE